LIVRVISSITSKSNQSLSWMRNPVLAADGQTYDRRNIEEWFSRNAGKTLKSPMTNQELTKTDLYPNHSLKSMIEEAVDAKVAEITARERALLDCIGV